MSPAAELTPRGRVALRVLGIGAAALAMTALVLAVGRRATPPRSEARPAARVDAASPPIAGEADVFRLTPADLAVPPEAERRPASRTR